MELIKWDNNKGYTIVLSPGEAEELSQKAKGAIETFHEEMEGLDIEVSPMEGK